VTGAQPRSRRRGNVEGEKKRGARGGGAHFNGVQQRGAQEGVVRHGATRRGGGGEAWGAARRSGGNGSRLAGTGSAVGVWRRRPIGGPWLQRGVALAERVGC
jgi:hypothetical protein